MRLPHMAVQPHSHAAGSRPLPPPQHSHPGSLRLPRLTLLTATCCGWQFYARDERLLAARAAVYAINAHMRERERERFEAFVESDGARVAAALLDGSKEIARSSAAANGATTSGSGLQSPPRARMADWKRLALSEAPPAPLVREAADVGPTPEEVYMSSMDRAQGEYERQTSLSGGGLRAACVRERTCELLPPELAHEWVRSGSGGGREKDRDGRGRGYVQRQLLRLLRLVEGKAGDSGQPPGHGGAPFACHGVHQCVAGG